MKESQRVKTDNKMAASRINHDIKRERNKHSNQKSEIICGSQLPNWPPMMLTPCVNTSQTAPGLLWQKW